MCLPAVPDTVTRVRIGKTPDGRRIEVSRELPVPADRAWSLLVDTERWPAWGPSVRAVDCSDREIKTGSTGHVETPVGIRVPFEITACEPYRWTWRVARIPATGHRVEELGPEHCRVVFEIPLLAWAYVPVCCRALSRIEAALR
ncbi:MAG: SRPBCC family protein [Halobacteriales archaeon]